MFSNPMIVDISAKVHCINPPKDGLDIKSNNKISHFSSFGGVFGQAFNTSEKGLR